MKKNSLIGILILLVAFAMTYAKIKANDAEKQAAIAMAAKEESAKLRDEAVALTQMAQESAAEALKQKNAAEQALADCQSK